MPLQLQVDCDCGWSFAGPEAELVPAVVQHGTDAHGMTLTSEQVLAAARPVPSSSTEATP